MVEADTSQHSWVEEPDMTTLIWLEHFLSLSVLLKISVLVIRPLVTWTASSQPRNSDVVVPRRMEEPIRAEIGAGVITRSIRQLPRAQISEKAGCSTRDTIPRWLIFFNIYLITLTIGEISMALFAPRYSAFCVAQGLYNTRRSKAARDCVELY